MRTSTYSIVVCGHFIYNRLQAFSSGVSAVRESMYMHTTLVFEWFASAYLHMCICLLPMNCRNTPRPSGDVKTSTVITLTMMMREP